MELVQIYYLKKNYSYYRYQFGNFLAFSQPWWWPVLWSHNTDAGYGISGTGDRELSAQREICRDPLPWTCLIVVLFHLRLRGWICVELKQKKRAGRNRKLNTSHLQWVKMPRDARGNAQSRPRGFHERCQVRGFREGTRHWRNHQLQLEAGPAVSKGGPNSIGGTVTDHKSIPLQGQTRFPQPLSAVRMWGHTWNLPWLPGPPGHKPTSSAWSQSSRGPSKSFLVAEQTHMKSSSRSWGSPACRREG